MSWLATWSDWLLAKPATIIGIILGALIVRWFVRRIIRRVTEHTANGKVTSALSPLKTHAPDLVDATGFNIERRRQRSHAIGSILSSASTAIIFTLAGLLILETLDVNIALLVTSAGIAGVALGFGAQSLVKDVLAGIFILAEDQYGVGDFVDVGEASGAIETVGLRITTLRDVNGVVWHVRNGEIIRVGNMSQGWARVVIDVPLPYGTDLATATAAINTAVDRLASDNEWNAELVEEPQIWGVEQLTPTGMMFRVVVKASSEGQWKIARHFRELINAALEEAGIKSGFPILPLQTQGGKK